MRSGNWLHFPYPGGAWSQPDGLLELIRDARRAWYVFAYMPKNKMRWSEEDSEFIAWVTDGSD